MPLSFCVIGSSYRRPIKRLIAKIVFSGLVMLCRLAVCPTRTSPRSVKATIDGVVRAPSAFSITLGLLPSITATQELVVPRSIPIALAMMNSFINSCVVNVAVTPKQATRGRPMIARNEPRPTGLAHHLSSRRTFHLRRALEVGDVLREGGAPGPR